MAAKILLTTFDTWRDDQSSNASDDLIAALLERQQLPERVELVRKIPVDFERSPAMVLSQVEQGQPQAIVCCGMAEGKKRLLLESTARSLDAVLHSQFDLKQLTAGLTWTEVSDDAGQFVCNATYYAVLSHVQRQNLPCQALFVHVPPLTPENLEGILADFLRVIERLRSQLSCIPCSI